jgi:hypothetical protein
MDQFLVGRPSGHNEEDILHYKEEHYDVALKHFQLASAVNSG